MFRQPRWVQVPAAPAWLAWPRRRISTPASELVCWPAVKKSIRAGSDAQFARSRSRFLGPLRRMQRARMASALPKVYSPSRLLDPADRLCCCFLFMRGRNVFARAALFIVAEGEFHDQ